MIYYHGSPTGGLTELQPFLSEHGKPYIYFSTNPLVALLYAVKPVPKPFSFYPYGFDANGNVVYSEYFENAFYELYKNQKGFLYECDDLQNIENPTAINCAITCTAPAPVDKVTEISDLYDYFMSQGDLFQVKPKQDVSEKEMNYILSALKADVEKYDLRNQPEHPMSVFLQIHFTGLF